MYVYVCIYIYIYMYVYTIQRKVLSYRPSCACSDLLISKHLEVSRSVSQRGRFLKKHQLDCSTHRDGRGGAEREFFIDNPLVRIHFIVMIKWTGLAPEEFEFPFSGSFTSNFLCRNTNTTVPPPPPRRPRRCRSFVFFFFITLKPRVE